VIAVLYARITVRSAVSGRSVVNAPLVMFLNSCVNSSSPLR
jgi:hypothetical protein